MFPPDLFSSTEFWTAFVVALVGGGGVGAIIGAVSSRRKDTAQIAAQACDILTDSVIKPLREQVESQEEQIQHLESQQRKYFALAAYTRSLFHWLQTVPAACRQFTERQDKVGFQRQRVIVLAVIEVNIHRVHILRTGR